MKAERRHELQTNTLAQFLSDLPLYIRFHANKILFGIIVICLIILLVRYRSNQSALARQATKDSLESAKVGIAQLRAVDRSQTTDASRSAERNKIASQIKGAVSDVLENTKDPDDSATRAQALLVQGDLNWTLANLPALPGAATQPQLASRQTPAEYLANAETAYLKVVKTYPDQTVAMANALLSLAAIEENRGNWDKAVEYYNKVIADESLARAFKDLARARLAATAQIRTPVYLGSYSATQPTTAESAMSPMSPLAPSTESSSSQPSTQPQ